MKKIQFLLMTILFITTLAAHASVYHGFYSVAPHYIVPSGPSVSFGMSFPAHVGYVSYNEGPYFVPMQSYRFYHVHHYYHYPVIYPNRYPKQQLWVNTATGTKLPHHTIVGGEQPGDKSPLYICRAEYLGGTHPGKLEQGKCNFTYHGNEIRTDRYQVLVSESPLRWKAASFGNVPPHSIVGGRDHGNPLYICQANYQNGRIPGKLIGETCHIGYQGQVIAMSKYHVLVA